MLRTINLVVNHSKIRLILSVFDAFIVLLVFI